MQELCGLETDCHASVYPKGTCFAARSGVGIRSQRGTAALTGRRGRRPLRNGLTRCAPVEAASSTLPAAFQKENTILSGWCFFCDCPQVLLPVRTPVYRKERNVCKGNLCGFPHSRSITRPQATTFAEQKCCSKKKDTRRGVFLFVIVHRFCCQ